jgi:hypothetical protein
MKELKLPARKVFKKADSAAKRPVTEVILCEPEPQAFNMDNPMTVMKVPNIIS